MSRRVRKLNKKVAVAVVISALVGLVSAASRAEDANAAEVALVWKAPADGGCATGEQIRREVERLSERSLVTRGQHFEIEALALFYEGNWVASVALRDESGRILGGREVSGSYASCRDLDVPVALVTATLLDGLSQKPAPVAPTQEAPSEQRIGIGVGAFLSGAFGLAPRLALGAGASVELPLAWPLIFSASAYLPGREVDQNGRGARAFSFYAGAQLCPRLFGQRHVLRLCGSAQAGAVVAKGEGLSESQTAARPLVMLGLEPELVLGLTASWALKVSLGAHWLPVRPRFHWEIEGQPEQSVSTETFALIARISVIDFLR